jgi:histidinol phosphatase-like PHP family hydrolase
MWPEEAAALVETERSLTELRAVGPFTASFIARWLRDRPEVAEPPPIRAGFLSYAAAREIVAAHPEWALALAVDHQMHSDETDGSAPLEEMAAAAAALGRERIAITDHSKTLRITNGMDEGRLAAQGARIDAFNARAASPRVLRGIEMDLTPEGVGDMDESAVAALDLVLGAFHSKLRLRDDQTERYRRALGNPNIDVLAHPRGRVYNFRLGLSADWDAVAAGAAETGTALEIDAYPDRQDLDIERLRAVAQAGAWISIGTDAHTPEELRYLELGVAAAISAGIERDRVLNCLDVAGLAERIGAVRATKRTHQHRGGFEMPGGKRERIDTTPGRKGGSRFVRRETAGQFSTDQTNAGRSVARDKRVKAKHTAPKGMKDRGD